jgi:hypothetical protein
MIIQPNWTVTNKGPWQLIYNDTSIVSLSEANGTTSTTDKIFVGTFDECETERIRLNLPWASEIQVEIPYVLTHENSIISFFGPAVDNQILNGIKFLGTYAECEAEIQRLGLTYPLPELPE